MGEHQHKNGVAQLVRSAEAYRLKKVDGVALSSHWSWIKEKLEIIQRKIDLALKKRDMTELPHPLPEQIRQVILNGIFGKNQIEAYFVLDRSEAIRGFFTINVPFHEFFQTQLSMYVWHAWGEPGVMAAVEPQVVKMARERGVLEIVHESPRFEWAARHRKDGYGLARMVWRKEIR